MKCDTQRMRNALLQKFLISLEREKKERKKDRGKRKVSGQYKKKGRYK